MSYIRSYNYLVYERLDKLDDDIETLAALKELPSEMYTYMQDEVNNEIFLRARNIGKTINLTTPIVKVDAIKNI